MPNAHYGGPIDGHKYIYIVGPMYRNALLYCNEEIKGPIKIGFEKNIHRRRSQYKSHSPLMQDILFYQIVPEVCGGAERIEYQAHKLLRYDKFHHEWFKIEINEAEQLVKKLLKKRGCALFNSASVRNWCIFSYSGEKNKETIERFYVDKVINRKNEKVEICLHSVSKKKLDFPKTKKFIFKSIIKNHNGNSNTLTLADKNSDYYINYTKIFHDFNDCLKYINSYYWNLQNPKIKQPKYALWKGKN